MGNPILTFVIEKFPFYIARNYKKMLDEESIQEKIKLILHTYDLTLRTFTVTLISQYLGKDKDIINDLYLNEIILKKFPQLTYDAWHNLFFTILDGYKSCPELLFMSELYDLSTASEKIKNNFQEPFRHLTQITAEYNVDELKPRTIDDWNSLCEISENYLIQLFNEVRFLENYHLSRVINKDINSYLVERYQGESITLLSVDINKYPELITGQFYWFDNKGNTLPLHPLFVFWEEPVGSRDIAVYDKLIVKRLQYLLSVLGKTIIDNGRVEEFFTLVFKTLEDAKNRKRNFEVLTWDILREKCLDISKMKMATVANKYRSNLYLPRKAVRDVFNKFLTSEKKCFVLIGKSGVGKSNFLLALADELNNRTDLSLLIFDGAQLRTDPSITDSVNREFLTRFYIEEPLNFNIWKEMDKLCLRQDRRVILIVDAINENPDAKKLLRQLDELVEGPWPWLKIVFTSRPETWFVIRRGVKLAEDLYFQEKDSGEIGIELEPFSYSEELQPFSQQELPEVYEKHRQAFNLMTNYVDLNHEIKKAIQDPLNLWLVANIYKDSYIPEFLYSNTLIEDYIDALFKSERLSRSDIHFLERKLVPLLSHEKSFSNFVSLEDIDSAGGVLFEEIYNEQLLRDGRHMNQAFTNLLDADILSRVDEGRNQKISFKYERFYEFFFGRWIYETAKTKSDILSFYRYLINQTSQHPFLWGAIRNALIQNVHGGEDNLIMNLCFTRDQNTKELLVASLTEAGATVDLETLLGNVLKFKSTNVIKTLVSGGNFEGVLINSKKIVVEVSSNLGMVNILSQIVATSGDKLRAHLVKYSYYLWTKDADKGWQLIKSLIGKVRNGLIINFSILSFLINLNLLIFLQHFDEPKFFPMLQQSFRETLQKALFLEETKPFWKKLKGWIREFIIQIAVGFVEEIASKSPRYFVANIAEIKTYFTLPMRDRSNVIRLIDYYEGLDNVNIEELLELIIEVLKTNDAYATYIVTHVIFTYIRKYKKEMFPSIKAIAFEELSLHPESAVPYQVLTPLYFACLFNSENIEEHLDVLQLILDIEKLKVNKNRGVHYYRGNKPYAGAIMCGSLALFDLETKGKSKQEFKKYPIEDYIKVAHEEGDWQFACDIIWTLGEMAVTYRKWSFSLNLIYPFLDFNHPKVSQALVQFLARLRQYQPHMVDDFLGQNDPLGNLTKRVMAAETSEQENSIFGQSHPFVYNAVGDSQKLRMEAAILYRGIAKSKNIREAIIIVIKRLINLAYGEGIFPENRS